MEPTLNNLLNESMELKKTLTELITNYEDTMKDLDDTLNVLNKEIFTADSSDAHELREHKSSLLLMKNELQDQIKESKNVLNQVNSSITLYQKAIQLNTGDIF